MRVKHKLISPARSRSALWPAKPVRKIEYQIGASLCLVFLTSPCPDPRRLKTSKAESRASLLFAEVSVEGEA